MVTGVPTISAIIAVRNGAATLQRALDSVFAQSYDATELIVIDGASTDGTRAILERSGGQIAYWESQPDRGIYHAWNKGLAHASGDWICFLGSDDRFASPRALQHAAAKLVLVDPDISVVYASINIVADDGSVVKTWGAPWPAVREQFTRGMSIPHPGTFHRRDLFAQRGFFDELFAIAGDYELLLRELPDRDALFIDGLVLVEMRAGGISDRPDRRVLLVTEAERARRMHDLATGPVWLAPVVIRARVRDMIRRILGARAEAAAVSFYRRLRSGVTRSQRD